MDPAINPSTAAQSQTARPPSARSGASLDYDSFLQLLIAQMKNQDPLNPVDSTEYVAQLAQFSTVEQSININRKLDSVLGSLTLTQAEGLIGRTITSADGVTSGQIVSAYVADTGVTATLTTGATVKLESGIVLS